MSDPCMVYDFTVLGDPKPQGSKSAFNAKGGRAMMKESGGAAFAAWRNAVAQKASDVCGDAKPLDGILVLMVTFRFRMPQSRSKADKNRNLIPKVHAPDLSKLVRSIEDSMQAAGMIADDARFYRIIAEKFEVLDGWTGAHIVVSEEPF